MELEVCISKVLCQLKYNFDKLVASELKSTLVGIHNGEELMKAKEALLNAVMKALRDLDCASWVPCLPKCTGDKKNKQIQMHRTFCHYLKQLRNGNVYRILVVRTSQSRNQGLFCHMLFFLKLWSVSSQGISRGRLPQVVSHR